MTQTNAMASLTLKQQAYVALTEPKERGAALSALLGKRCLFAEVVVCDYGQFSTGSTSNAAGISSPCLALDKTEIEREIAQMQESYLDQIEQGERDEDDEWEGQLMRVIWNIDDTLSFYSICDENCEHALARKAVTECCGD